MLPAAVQLSLIAAIFIAGIEAEIAVHPSPTSTHINTENRDARLFGLFDMVTLNNRACRALSGEIGTCLSYAECFAFRGNVSGTCGRGFGFCCVSTKTCQGVVYSNNTYFVNPGYPNSLTTPGQCYVTVNRLAPTVCQLRLDFEIFSIAQPEEVDHRCVTDSFVVSGSTSPVPTICGDNAGQHMYLNIGYNNTQPVMLTMITSNPIPSLITARSWKIRISQIPCNEGYAAPNGCLQYFTGNQGSIRSFNFFFDTRSRTVARQLSYQDYTICIRQEYGFCEMQYDVCPDRVNIPGLGFSVSGSLVAGDVTVASATDENCVGDYVLIPCGSDVRGQTVTSRGGVCPSRFCGSVLSALNAVAVPSSVFTRSTPFELRYHTDGFEALNGEQGNLGFCLTYQQLPCPALVNTNLNNFVI